MRGMAMRPIRLTKACTQPQPMEHTRSLAATNSKSTKGTSTSESKREREVDSSGSG